VTLRVASSAASCRNGFFGAMEHCLVLIQDAAEGLVEFASVSVFGSAEFLLNALSSAIESSVILFAMSLLIEALGDLYQLVAINSDFFGWHGYNHTVG